ncbi:hypothetical protein FPV67DRAFT_167776 [Lyophyllum atratum]|nr:hypothetical protein FPV67DRAFT_167776 [Lyophyllum atratum]
MALFASHGYMSWTSFSWDSMEATWAIVLDARRVARSLSVRPERGKLMRTFKQRNYAYRMPIDIESWTENWYSFLTILEHATSVNVVELMYIPASVADMLAHVLSNLRQVHTCTITRPGGGLDIDAIQTFIMSWEHLRVLNLTKWEHHEGLEPPSMRPHLQCRIEELKLENGLLTGPQLSRFTASPTPHLKVLELYGVSGLSNHDFFLFLISVPTLTQLSIACSSLSRSSDEEERALDAAIPMLEALCSVRVESAHVSALALSRKPPLRQEPGAQKKHSEIVIEPATE